MKTKFPKLLGVFAAIFMVASFVIPANIAAPAAVSADPGIMKWDTVSTPNSVIGKNDIVNTHGLGANTGQGSDIIAQVAGNDGATIASIVRNWVGGTVAPFAPGYYTNIFHISLNGGISSTTSKYAALTRNPNWIPGCSLYQVAIAPDDPKFIAVTSDVAFGNPAAVPPVVPFGPRRIWVTTDSGSNWDLAFDGGIPPLGPLTATETIRDLDISIDYGGKRDLGFVTTDASAVGGRWFVRSSTGFNTWEAQLNVDGTPGGAQVPGLIYQDIKFSPTYNGDSSVALVYSTDAATAISGHVADATFFNVAFRDLNQNDTLAYAYGFNGIEVKDPASVAGASAGADFVNNIDLELPSDFSGQSSSLRRAYVSIDAYGSKAATTCEDGIYRVDDTVVYELMDTTSTAGKAIYSIAYFGTYASGKLLAGERMGFPCTATVPTWFTDSPTTCPIPCWYPALKPTTGAASQGICVQGRQDGLGGAIVNWNADGSLGYVGTGSLPWYVGPAILPFVGPPFAYQVVVGKGIEIAGARNIIGFGSSIAWWYPSWTGPASIPPVVPVLWADGNSGPDNDESAFAISRNNGETWNQIILIDTTIDWFNDVAIAPDCTTIYLASVNRNVALPGSCNEFDSVWRATVNPNVAAPLPALPPLGTYWERVFTHVTSGNCNLAQTDMPILRLVNSCTDKKDGEIVGWAAERGIASQSGTGGVLAWSPDFGDYWAVVTPRDPVQDFAFETSTTIYTVSATGLVQKLPYTGTAWSTNLPSYDITLGNAHTIAAVPDGKVLVGTAFGVSYPVAYSANAGLNWAGGPAIVGHGNEHVIFDVDFKNNQFIYMGDDSAAASGLGTVYRNTAPSFTKWVDNDMMSEANGASGIAWPAGLDSPPHPIGIFGIAQAWTGASPVGSIPYGPALYAAHDNLTLGYSNWTPARLIWGSAVCRTLVSRAGMPKPGVQWDCLDVFAPLSTRDVMFTLEPSSLKYCGCCTLDTNTTLYAIDDERGWINTLIPGIAPVWLSVPTIRTVAAGDGRWNAGLVPPALLPAAGPNISGAGYTPNINKGMLWAYTDCLAKKGPILKTPADKYLVGADPVTGRNQQVDLSWEQLCLATGYELQVAKDQNFTLRINPIINSAGIIAAVTGSILLDMDSTNMTSPAAWIAPGALPEAGAIYWWRIRVYRSATSQLAWSPWSEARSFTVKAGFIVNTPYYGVQLLSPNNGCIGCKVKPASFSWSPWKEATKYQFDLSKDPEFKQLVVTATTTTTGYEYKGTLDYSTNYFWRVKALEVNNQNIPSDWSATFSFQTEPAPAPPAPPAAEPGTPLWVWVIIAIGAILVIVTLILIFKTRRV